MASKKRPRAWSPLDLDFFGRGRVQALADEHGPAGPLAWVCLILEARKVALITTSPDRQGELSMRYSTLAEMTFASSAEEARNIVGTCIDLGLLEPRQLEPERFHVRLIAWWKWEPADVNAASRKQRSRLRQSENRLELDNGHEPYDDLMSEF